MSRKFAIPLFVVVCVALVEVVLPTLEASFDAGYHWQFRTLVPLGALILVPVAIALLGFWVYMAICLWENWEGHIAMQGAGLLFISFCGGMFLNVPICYKLMLDGSGFDYALEFYVDEFHVGPGFVVTFAASILGLWLRKYLAKPAPAVEPCP